jgi:Putative sensor
MTWLLGAWVERRTYRVALYLLLGLPLGVLDFVLLVTGLSLGLGLLVTLLGIPLLLATLQLARALAGFERRLAWSLLDATMPHGRRPSADDDNGLWRRLRKLVTGSRTWWEVGFLALRFPLGLVGFVVVVVIAALALSGVAEPIVVAAGAHTELGSWTIDTFWESLVMVPVSIVFLAAGPRLVQCWGKFPAWVATSMLGRVEQTEVKCAVLRTLGRTGESDGFQLLDELELQIGRGPFLNATRVEAAVLALESNGLIVSRHEGDRVLYAPGPGSQQR